MPALAEMEYGLVFHEDVAVTAGFMDSSAVAGRACENDLLLGFDAPATPRNGPAVGLNACIATKAGMNSGVHLPTLSIINW